MRDAADLLIRSEQRPDLRCDEFYKFQEQWTKYAARDLRDFHTLVTMQFR